MNIYDILHNSQKFGYIFVWKSTELTKVSGTLTNFLQNQHKYRVLYGCGAERTNVSRIVYKVVVVPVPGYFTRVYPYPGYFSIGVQNAHKCRVRV